MKLRTSEKFAIGITLLFLALALGFIFGRGESEVSVEFGESSFQSRGAGQVAGEDSALAAGGEEAVGLININTASAAQLETLKGIGPVLAQRIIEYRESKGGFKTIEDITKVRGIGASVYNDIWMLISVE